MNLRLEEQHGSWSHNARSSDIPSPRIVGSLAAYVLKYLEALSALAYTLDRNLGWRGPNASESFGYPDLNMVLPKSLLYPNPGAGKAGLRAHEEKDHIAREHLEHGEFKKASSLFQENLAWSESIRGPRDAMTLEDQDLLSFNLHELGRYKEAEALDRRTLHVRRKDQGDYHADTLETQHNLAFNLFKLGRYTEAAALDRKTLRAREKAQGVEDEESLSSRHNLAASLQELKVHGEAADLNRQTLKFRERNCNKDDNDLIASRHNLAINLRGLAQYDESTKLLRRNLITLRKTRESDDPHLNRNESSLAYNLDAIGHNTEANRDRARDDEQKISRDPISWKQKERRTIKRGRDDPVINGDRNGKDDSPRQHTTQAWIPAAIHDSNSEEASRAKIQRPRNITYERESGKEKPREELRVLTRTQDRMITHLDMPKNGGPANAPGVKARQKRASSASNPAMQGYIPIEALSDPTTTSLPERRKVDQKQDLVPIPVAKNKRLRAKSDQDLKKSSNKENLEAPIAKTTRPTSIGPQLPPPSLGFGERDFQNSERAAEDPECPQTEQRFLRPQIKDQPIIQISQHPIKVDSQHPVLPAADGTTSEVAEAPVMRGELNVYSSLCDAHGSAEDPYASNAADEWFRLLEEHTQALLEPYRKDRMRRVKIAILDTGIDRTHPRIEAQWNKRVKDAKSWIDGEGGDRDTCGHGTHNTSLLMKVAPEALIYVARVVKDYSGSLNDENVAKAIVHATDEWKVDIITMSFGYPRRYTHIERAINLASNKDILMLAAAANSGANRKIAFPASSSRVICINSADGRGARSRYNPPPHPTSHNFSVLGEAVPSAWPRGLNDSPEKRNSGTSTSTPIAAAIAALILEFAKQPNLHISHHARLNSLESMKEIFARMSEEKDGYRFLVPWKLLDEEVGRNHVASRISDILLNFFGAEHDPR